MTDFAIHTTDTTQPKSAELLKGVAKAYGFVPNLMGVFAESPATLEAYLNLGKLLDGSSFDATELQTVILAISRENNCEYCVAAHTTVAAMQGVPADVVDAIRSDEPIADARLETLRRFATLVVQKRGWLEDEEVAQFLAAGFTRQQVLEVILAVAFKTLSNYTNHIAATPLDAAFGGNAWRAAA